MLALSDAVLVALIGAATSGVAAILAGMAAIIGRLNRREITAPDRNGNTLRDEVINVERMLGEHVRQTEEAITQIGHDRGAIVEWLRREMGKDEG